MQEPGTIVGERYRLVRKIGEGGIAAVWRGEHLTLGSPIAIKFLHRTGPMQSEASQRFLREARVAASVRHHNVVEIVDFGFADGEIPYMVMEFLEGKSLGDYLAEVGRLSFSEAAQIVAGTLRGLVAVHAAGLVHRDIKPDNVFLVNDPEEGPYAKLVDFGLSRRAGRSDMTAEGTLMGTPQYMSPEQAAGNADIDGRTDIYAMGVVLYELVSGQVPFDSDQLAEILQAVINDRPKPIRELVPDIPEKLEFVIETAMAKDREHRFVDARAMRLSLVDSGLFTSNEPVSGLITRPLEELSKPRATPTLPGPEELARLRPSGRMDPSGRLDASGAQRARRDPSLGKSRDESDSVAVFAVKREEADQTGEVAEAPPARRASATVPIVLAIILTVAIVGVAVALAMNGQIPGMRATTTVGAGPSDGAVETVEDAGADLVVDDEEPSAVDAAIEGIDAAPAVDAAPAIDPEPTVEAPPARGRPTKRARPRRPRRRGGR